MVNVEGLIIEPGDVCHKLCTHTRGVGMCLMFVCHKLCTHSGSGNVPDVCHKLCTHTRGVGMCHIITFTDAAS